MPEFLKDNPKYHRAATQSRAVVKAPEGIIEGYPIVFNETTNIGGYFYESIDARALDGADLSDIKFLINHNDGMIPVARHRRGQRSTMDVEIDERGLHIVANLDVEHNATAAELFSAVEREDITDMSFCFGIIVGGEEWSDLDQAMPTRKITKISKVTEISAVNDGAYPQTYIAARSAAPLDNDKTALDNARAAALDNAQKQEERRQAALKLKVKTLLFLEEHIK